jgi:putative intracellular protease/amidase
VRAKLFLIRRIAPSAAILVVMIIALVSCAGKQSIQQSANKEVLAIFPHGFGINYYLLQDVMDQYGWDVTYAGMTDSVEVCGPFAAPRGGLAMKVDTLLAEMTDITGYDAVVVLSSTQFSGDDPYFDIMSSEHAMNLIAAAASNDIPVFTTCAGVRILAALNLIDGKKVTGSKRFQAEFEAAGATYLGVDPAPQILGNLITSSRGQYNNIPNGIALSTVIERREAPPLVGRQEREFIREDAADFAAGLSTWARTYGGGSADGAQAVCATKTGGLLAVGYTFSRGARNADLLAIRADAAGRMVWFEIFGGSGTEYGYACTEVANGFVITGYTTSPCPELTDKQVMLLKIDADGNEMWLKTFGASATDVGRAVCAVEDGYVVCGYTESQGAGEADILVIKTDLEGNELWSKTFGGEFTDLGNSVHATGDGGLIIGATTNSFGGGNSDPYLIRTDAEGNQIWANAYHPTGEHGHGFDWCNDMCVTSKGEYYLVGYTDCDDLMNTCLIKVDADGNQVWAKSFGDDFYDYGNTVCPAPGGGVYIGGTTKALFNNNDMFMAKLDTDGNMLWEKTIGGNGADWASGMCVTPDGGCIIVGHTNSCGAGSFDACAVKISAL